MFVAINFIDCDVHYQERFEELFQSRAGEIDTMPGFQRMEVLRPRENGGEYLIMSHWDDEESFKQWTKSNAFIKGHSRGFEDIRKAKEAGQKPPMRSSFKTYNIISQ